VSEQAFHHYKTLFTTIGNQRKTSFFENPGTPEIQTTVQKRQNQIRIIPYEPVRFIRKQKRTSAIV
jgi:hypothetical protein